MADWQWKDTQDSTWEDTQDSEFAPQEETTMTGTVAGGHDTNVEESYARDFTGNGTGTGSIINSGDDEAITLATGDYMESETGNIGSGDVRLRQNVYKSGDNATLYYKSGDTEANCESDTGHAYSSPFSSAGWIKVRVER